MYVVAREGETFEELSGASSVASKRPHPPRLPSQAAFQAA